MSQPVPLGPPKHLAPSLQSTPVPPRPETAAAPRIALSPQEVEDAIVVVDPFAIRFSQTSISHSFMDGSAFAEGIAQCAQSIEECRSCIRHNGKQLQRSFMRSPFPLIQVLRYRAKLRRHDGIALLDANGAPLWGEERWYTVDNRRLYCMQRAAVEAWPRRCCIPVQIVDSVLSDTGKGILKFKTTDEGASIEVHAKPPASKRVWDWRGALRERAAESMPSILAEVECEEQLLDGHLAWPSPRYTAPPASALSQPTRRRSQQCATQATRYAKHSPSPGPNITDAGDKSEEGVEWQEANNWWAQPGAENWSGISTGKWYGTGDWNWQGAGNQWRKGGYK